MSDNNQSLKKEQVKALINETKDRRVINDYFQEVIDNAKILDKLGLYEKIGACQRYLDGRPPVSTVQFMPGFISQSPVIDCLPETLRHIVLHLSAKTRFDHLTCTMAVVMVIAIALCGRFRIKLEPGWEEAVLLYSMMIAESGSQKDSLINMVRHPLDQAMKELQDNYDKTASKKKMEHTVQQEVFKSNLRADIKRISKVCYDPKSGNRDYEKGMKDAQELFERAEAIRERLEAKKPGVRPNLRFSNITPQGLINGLIKQGGYQAAIEAEAGLIEKIITLGARFNIDPFLVGYEQSDYLSGNAHNQLHLIKLSLNLFYCAQPVIASKFFRKYADEERGLAPRFMPIFSYKSRIPAPDKYSHQFQFFHDMVKLILKYNFTQDSHREIYTLGVTSSGHAKLKEFQRHNQELTQNGNEHMAAPLRKLHGKAGRIAGVFHLWECFVNGTITDVISDQAIEAGIAIAQILIPHTDHAFSPAGLIGVDPADRVLRWIRDTEVPYFDYSTAKSAIDSNLNGDQIKAGLQRLISCCILGKIHDHKGLPYYVVNPQIGRWFVPPVIQTMTRPMIPDTPAISSHQEETWDLDRSRYTLPYPAL